MPIRYVMAVVAVLVCLLLPATAQADPITFTGSSNILSTPGSGTSLLSAGPASFNPTFAQPPQTITLILGDVGLYDSPGATYDALLKIGLTFTEPSYLDMPLGTFEIRGVGTQESGVLLSVTQPGPQTIHLGGDIYALNLHLSQNTISVGQGTLILLSLTNTTATPEPTTLILFGTGLAGIAAKVYRRRKRPAQAKD